jgi:ankyrin repeat protein
MAIDPVLYISVSSVNPSQKATYPDAAALTKGFLKEKPLSDEALQKILQAYVLAGTHPDIIKLLIENGADVNYSYTGGDKLLRMAHQNGNTAVTNLLLKEFASLTDAEKRFFRDIDPEFANSVGFLKAAEKPEPPDHASKPAI